MNKIEKKYSVPILLKMLENLTENVNKLFKDNQELKDRLRLVEKRVL